MKKVYINFVIQTEDNHRHDFEIVEFKEGKIALYSDYTSQQVIEWSKEKQKQLKQNEKLVIINYFQISNLTLD